MDSDWKEILNLSQNELKQCDKDKLCENLAWMEADDIELNFSDLKALFRLTQDILKYKTEQVNGLLGKLESTKRKGKSKGSPNDKSYYRREEVVNQEEEEVKANTEILKRLYADIAELEKRKSQLKKNEFKSDMESESSQNTLSELNTIAQLESELLKKNRHLKKLLSDVTALEEENAMIREKLSIFKDKLKESTRLIENLTKEIFSVNNENSHLRDVLASSEQLKSKLSIEIKTLKQENAESIQKWNKVEENFKAKLQQLKISLKSHAEEIDRLSNENLQLKQNFISSSESKNPPKVSFAKDEKIKELQEKLKEAAEEMTRSANLIQILKAENNELKNVVDGEPEHSVSDHKNESDDGKEKRLINRLNKKIKKISSALKGAEEMVSIREQEIAEITSRLQLLQSDEGIATLLKGIKTKKRLLKFKDEGIRTLVEEVNNLNLVVSDLQLENETMRAKLNIPYHEKIPTFGVLKKIDDMERENQKLTTKAQKYNNRIIESDLENRTKNKIISKLVKFVYTLGGSEEAVNALVANEYDDQTCLSEKGDRNCVNLLHSVGESNIESNNMKTLSPSMNIQAVVEENEGLRNSLTEILSYLKDSTTTSGVLSFECPSLEAILQSMEARRLAGWYSPHMKTVMELRSVTGGRDALLNALHESRKETFDVMSKLSEETNKSLELQKQLSETKLKEDKKESSSTDINICEFGSWISEKEYINVDVFDKCQIEKIMSKGDILYEDRLKKCLQYFQNKFTLLYDKLTAITVSLVDSQNQWSIQEEYYKAQIENLRQQLCENDEDETSNQSPGLLSSPNFDTLQRKCSYLEDAYRHMRTLYENIKNEYLQSKKETMIMTSEYETKIQSFMLGIINITDKLRNTVPLNLYRKQNKYLDEIVTKYRVIIEMDAKKYIESTNLLNRLNNDKSDIISRFFKEDFKECENSNISTVKTNLEMSILQEHLNRLCAELDNKAKELEHLEKKLIDLQRIQTESINKTVYSNSDEEKSNLIEQVKQLQGDNKILKEQYQNVSDQLDIAVLQLKTYDQNNLSNDMELNILRHQILDLQATGNNKAVIARLSGEILFAQLQSAESLQKIDILKLDLNKEKQLKADMEKNLINHRKIFETHIIKYENKIRLLYEMISILKQEYQGSLPITCVEIFMNRYEELYRKDYEVDEKLNEIEDIRSNLIIKHSIYNQILDLSSTKCFENDDSCSHKLKSIVDERIQETELDYCKKKLESNELSRKTLTERCYNFEKKIIAINQAFEGPVIDVNTAIKKSANIEINEALELENIANKEETNSECSLTYTLINPTAIKNVSHNGNLISEVNLSPKNNGSLHKPQLPTYLNKNTQTTTVSNKTKEKEIQTDTDENFIELQTQLQSAIYEKDNLVQILDKIKKNSIDQARNITDLETQNNELNIKVNGLVKSNSHKETNITKLLATIDGLKEEIDSIQMNQLLLTNKSNMELNERNQSLLLNLKKIENDKNTILAEYKELLNSEREEFLKKVKELQSKLYKLQDTLDQRGRSENGSGDDITNDASNKLNLKVIELENKCFNINQDLVGSKVELDTVQNELERWKSLATERLTKMEQLSAQLNGRHEQEMESYKAENQHWITQLHESQREHTELRTRAMEQKAMYLKQLSEKDTQIEQLRFHVNNLKSQMLNMQTMLSINDPNFDLSAIVEVDEVSDAMSQQDSDKLELKFDSTVDLNNSQDDFYQIPSSSTAICEYERFVSKNNNCRSTVLPLIDRLRKEKHFISKQNAMLRRQVKAVAARERRARLDAQNLKNQVFRISTNGSKVPSAESAAMQHKIVTLQAQLTSARRETHSTVALWDKCKRSQQASERWQCRYEEKCQEIKKLETSLLLAKSAVTRLEKEKRILLSRLSESKQETQAVIEKQDGEKTEKSATHRERSYSPQPISSRALLDRVEAQQRRIIALEVAEKGNEPLVLEYEKALAQITSLKGQVIKLESTILESQIRTPIKESHDTQPELEYWKNYCEMLKEENVQLNLRLSSLESAPSSAPQHRVNDLEQTVLTLRGLVSKLQADQRSSTTSLHKRVDTSVRGGTDKVRSQIESCRIEITNLKRTIIEKDLLLEKSKEMLKIAAEREEELLRENTQLHRRLEDILSESKNGFLSA